MAVKRIYSGAYEIIVDTTEVAGMLDALAVGLSAPSLELFLREDVSRYFEEDISGRFEAEGDAKSGEWAPLSEATIEIRNALGFGEGPINVRTGELKEHVTEDREFFAGVEWTEMQIPGQTQDAVIAQKLSTAQRGSNSNPIPQFGPTPARPVLAADEADLMKVMEMFVVHIEALLISGGFGAGMALAGA